MIEVVLFDQNLAPLNEVGIEDGDRAQLGGALRRHADVETAAVRTAREIGEHARIPVESLLLRVRNLVRISSLRKRRRLFLINDFGAFARGWPDCLPAVVVLKHRLEQRIDISPELSFGRIVRLARLNPYLANALVVEAAHFLTLLAVPRHSRVPRPWFLRDLHHREVFEFVQEAVHAISFGLVGQVGRDVTLLVAVIFRMPPKFDARKSQTGHLAAGSVHQHAVAGSVHQHADRMVRPPLS